MNHKSKKTGSRHYYGWKRQQPDRRDFRFRVPHHVLQTLPASVDLTSGMGSVLDQGNLGSCGPNSSDSLIMFDQQKESLPVSSSSRLFIYYATRQLMGTTDQDSGVDNRTMLKALNQFGFCDESLWPYNTDTFTKNPPQSVWSAALANAITNYAAVNQTLDEMCGTIASGFPFLFGFTVYESFESDAAARTGIIPMPLPSENVLGGHDIVFCGYSNTQQAGIKPGNIWPANTFRFKNSWSEGWGDGGYGYMPYAYATNPNMAGDFWVVNAIPNGQTPPPSPIPTPNPPSPTPTPPGPSNIQAEIDAIFARLIARFARRHLIVMMLQTVQGMVDAYLQSHPISGGTVQQAIDAVFAALEAAAPNPYVRFMLQIVQNLIDQWLQQQSGARMYAMNWPAIWEKIQAMLKLLGPLAVPMVEAWIATLPLTPVQRGLIDSLIEQVLGAATA